MHTHTHTLDFLSFSVNNDVECSGSKLHMACRVFNCTVACAADGEQPAAASQSENEIARVLVWLLTFPFVFSHPRPKRAFYAKLELITRIYYDVIRFVHICLCSLPVILCFVSLSLTLRCKKGSSRGKTKMLFYVILACRHRVFLIIHHISCISKDQLSFFFSTRE